MNEEPDELARTAADVLVSALVTDSWQAVKRRFAALIGHESRMDTTHAELIAVSGAARDGARRAQVRTWNIRLRDMLEDDPDAADALRELLAGVATASGGSGPPMASLAGTWQGTYTCAQGQGLTGVQIVVGTENVTSGAAPVQLSTYPVPSNPGVPRGSAAAGRRDVDGHLCLCPGRNRLAPGGAGILR